MSYNTLYFLKDQNGVYEHIRSVDPDLNTSYKEFFQAISAKDLIQCLRLLKNHDDTFTFLNQLTFICDSKCCNTNCLALNLCHLAVLNDCKEILEELLKCGGDLSRKTVGVTISENQRYFVEKESVMDLIIRRFNEPVQYFKDLFDGYIENSELGSSYEFQFDFSILCPSSCAKKGYPEKYDHQMCVLNQIVNSSNNVYSPECNFLQHPLIQVFLTCKWRHYRRFFYILVAIHILFVIFLSATAVLIVNNYERFLEIKQMEQSNTYLDIEIIPTFRVLNILLILVGFQLFCHAVIQACFIPLRKLIYEFEIISNLLTSTFALLNCTYGLIQPLNWQLKNHFQLIYSLNSLIVLPAWINLMLIIGRIPSLGCYSLMLTTVMKNFLKVMVSFIFLIVGFAMSFSLIFPMSEYFNSPLRAILRTTVMMMGEFEYSQMFTENTAATSKLIFVLFVVSCSIILMNLTQGIAVNDIQILHQISQTIRLEKETRFLYEFEAIFTQKIMTSNRILRKIKKRLYDTGAIGTIITISKKNRQILSSELLSELIQCYKPTKSIWSRKLSYPKFYFQCLPNRFDVINHMDLFKSWENLQPVGIPQLLELPVGQVLYDQICHFGPVFTTNTTGSTLFQNSITQKDLDQYFAGSASTRISSTAGFETLAFIRTRNSRTPTDVPNIEIAMGAVGLASDGGNVVKEGANFRDDIYQKAFKELENRDHFTTIPVLLSPKSKGSLWLRDRNPFSPSEINPNYLKEQEDVEFLLEGIKETIRIAKTPAMQKINATLWQRKVPGCEHLKFGTDDYWRCSIRVLSYNFYHYIGTCKMGPDSDPMGVVDPRLKVRGIRRLRVVDNSVVPSMPSGHTHAVALLIGEKAADLIKEEWGQ